MIAQLIALLCSAFPLRGNVVQPANSPLVLDRDTVLLVEGPRCVCICGGTSKGLNVSTDTAGKIHPFPGTFTSFGSFVEILGTGSKLKGTDNSGMIPVCSTWVANPPESSRRFILHGKTADWAVWAHSIYPSNRIRWRWSQIQANAPWVRWIDELKLGQSQNPSRGTPVLTTLAPIRLRALRPGWETDQGLTMQATPAKGPTIEWSYRSIPGNPKGGTLSVTPYDSIQKGTLFRVLDAYKTDQSDIQWFLPTESEFTDNFCISGSATSRLERNRFRFAGPRTGTTAVEPSTGRKIVLDTPLPTGAHLLSGPNGTRIVIVE